MSDREAFQKSIKAYLKAGGSSQTDLAYEMHYKREHLNKILNGQENMPVDFAQRAVKALANLNCIRGKDQARRLLRLMDAPDFPAADWNTEPLADLDDTISRNLTGITNVSISQPETVPDPQQSSTFSLWTVPYHRNPFFTGRADLLDRLHQQLTGTTATRRVALTQAIKGLGGIGKTQIAVEYAYRSHDADRYTHILWVNAANTETIIASFVAIAELIPSFPAKDETDQPKLVAAVIRWLEECKQRWLLIFDNADDLPILPEYLPRRGNGNVLLTTRSDDVNSLAVSITVENMSLMEGTKLLLQRTGRFEQALDTLDKEIDSTTSSVIDEATGTIIDEATNLVIVLDCFPLALDQAGAYIASTGCSIVDYLHIYQDHRKELLEQRGLQATNYPNSVATTWSLSFQKVEEDNPAAAELLRLCAFLAPDRIPEELIRDGSAHWNPPLQQAASDLYAFNQMIKELLKFSLVKRLTETNMLSIHRLVQIVQMDTMAVEVQHDWAKKVLLAVNDIFPRRVSDVATWPQCLRYLEQVQVCHTFIRQHLLILIEAADLLNRAGLYLGKCALHDVALPLLQHALEICEQQLGPQHPETATSLSNLAGLFERLGKYDEAEPLYRRALAIAEQKLGPQHSDTATILNNLAALLVLQGKYDEAEPLHLRALAIAEQLLGSDHPEVGISLNNLAELYSQQGKYDEAKLLYQRALTICEQQLGPQHPDTATILDNLAQWYRRQERYTDAEQLYQRALAIREQHLGLQHPQTASSFNNLAMLYESQEKYMEVEQLYQRTLATYEQRLGPQHPETATILSNLAGWYESQERYAEAEPLYQRALQIREQQLGLQHPDTATTLNNLAFLYGQQGKFKEAEPLCQHALQIREQQLGVQDPDTAISLSNLAFLYSQQGKFKEAEPLYQRALASFEKQLGLEHPHTANLLDNLASLFERQGKYEEAAPLYQRVLQIREQQLGLQHPDTATSLNNLAFVYSRQGKYDEAGLLYQRALAIFEEQLGAQHPDTIASLSNLAFLYKQQKRFTEAASLYHSIVALREQSFGPSHPNVAKALHNFAILRQEQGNYEEARSLYERALAIRTQTFGPTHPQTRETHKCLQAVLEMLDNGESVTPPKTAQREQVGAEEEQQRSEQYM